MGVLNSCIAEELREQILAFPQSRGGATSGFHRPDRHRVNHARGAVRGSASRIKGDTKGGLEGRGRGQMSFNKGVRR